MHYFFLFVLTSRKVGKVSFLVDVDYSSLIWLFFFSFIMKILLIFVNGIESTFCHKMVVTIER
jgi:hypothetical protein